MATESFVAVALPHSADPAAPWHLSVHVSHRLTPSSAQDVLADFPGTAGWTARATDAEVRVTVGAARGRPRELTGRVLTDPLQPDLWDAALTPATLPVTGWTVPDRTSRAWRTWPAHRAQADALLVHALSVFSSPVVPPPPGGSALTGIVLGALGLGQRGKLSLEQVLDGSIDALATRRLDELARTDGEAADTLRDLVTRALVDGHLARRYYQRPEERRDYREHPVEGMVAPRPVVPATDFARRIASFGDHPRLLRALGLVLDVSLDDPAALAGAVWVRASLVVPDGPEELPPPRTACTVEGTTWTVPSRSDAWRHGRLRVGDEDRFTLLDLDPDAAALSLEQFLRTIPRLQAADDNGDSVTAAPATLRATGFALAEVDRATGLRERLSSAAADDAALVAGSLAPLRLEQVARGLRLEVWDDVSRRWHSLHWRAAQVLVDGREVLAPEPEQAFLQGASLTRSSDDPSAPLHAHEVLAGWDGWSLAVPPPGGVVVHDEGAEEVVDPADLPHADEPVQTVSRVVPGTLPRLRYGRRYSLRAFSVDLAGNSSPHPVVGPDGKDPARVRPSTRPSTPVPERADRRATALRGAEVAEAVQAVSPPSLHGPGTRTVGPGRRTAAKVTGRAELDRIIADRLGPLDVTGASRRQSVADTFSRATSAVPHLMERTDLTVSQDEWGSVLVDEHLVPARPALPSDLVTAPRPFLRWDAVGEPVVAPRHPYTEAESQLRLVLRSGVDVGPGPTTHLVEPGAYADATRAAHPGLGLTWREDCQRHLLPPKTSQLTAEQHGLFDAALDGGPAERRQALAVALREAGTLFDTTVADLTTPGARLPQPGVSFALAPSADPPPAGRETPADLPRGDSPVTGQYVLHDVDEVVLPWLPDPLAEGLGLVFPDARPGGHLAGLLAVESARLDYGGTWPERVPYRLVLRGGPELGARVDGNLLEVTLPPGEQLRITLSSALTDAGRDLLGLWRSLPALLRESPVVAEAATDGLMWWLTPATTLTLVHAVPRPVHAPRILTLLPVREVGATTATLFGAVDVHGPSTGRLDLHADWTEQHDDPSKPGPETLVVTGIAAGTSVDPDEDLVVLTGRDDTVPLPDRPPLRLHAAVHALDDTRHRLVDYTARASTRYREFFPPQVVPSREDQSVLSAVRQVSLPSTARPAGVAVRDVLPLFRWSTGTEEGQPLAAMHVRRAGLRLYLERPWFSSGDGELLAVLLSPSASPPDAVARQVSSWGGDPVWAQDGPRSEHALPLVELLHLVGLDDREVPGRPVTRPVRLATPDGTTVTAIGYRPEYSADRGLWFVDVALDPGTALWPFVKLAVARYQPDSLPGLHLGPVTVCDWAQPAPERTTTVARADATHVRVAVSGPVGLPRGPGRAVTGPSPDFATLLGHSRTVHARLERSVPEVGTDLGWQVLSVVPLPVAGVAGTRVTWAATLEIPGSDPVTPGAGSALRVVVEEREHLPTDPGPDGRARTSSRVCFADSVPL